jgi:hypothetical protein
MQHLMRQPRLPRPGSLFMGHSSHHIRLLISFPFICYGRDVMLGVP